MVVNFITQQCTLMIIYKPAVKMLRMNLKLKLRLDLNYLMLLLILQEVIILHREVKAQIKNNINSQQKI